MASNSFGQLFRITTWGESHGKAIGVVIDGCPAGISLTQAEINSALALRAPGRSPHTSPRREPDTAELYSGVFEGKTTGAPISIIIANRDADSKSYEANKQLLKPGHANYTYLQKYGYFDYRGGGRASARETACRVAAGAVAAKLLAHFGVNTYCYLRSIHDIEVDANLPMADLRESIHTSPIFCPDSAAERLMIDVLESARAQGDSLGGVVGFAVEGLSAGLGDPVYEKCEAKLASAMLSIPASKGFEMGEGFNAARLTGSQHNDAFTSVSGEVSETNHAGGTLGGIATGMPIIGRVAFKPTSSIRKPQSTVDLEGNPATFELDKNARHDPCVAIRAVPVVQAMCQLVIADLLLMNRCARVEFD